MSKPALSIVLACYNEGRGIPEILARFEQAGRGCDFELILVDNGSTDGTPVALKELLPRHAFARSLRIENNRGYGDGVFRGLQDARGEVLCWSHADLQTDPADVFRAWSLYQSSADPRRTLIKGRRRGRRASERLISVGMQTVATVLLRTPLHEINAQPKMFHRDLLAHLESPPLDFNFDVYVVYRAKCHGWKCCPLMVAFPPRVYGHSHWATTWNSKARTMLGSFRYLCRLAAFGRSLEVADGNGKQDQG